MQATPGLDELPELMSKIFLQHPEL